MRIAVTAENDKGLGSPVAHHFGHAPYYAFVEVEGAEIKSVEVLVSPFLQGHEPGEVPAFVKEQGAEVILSGGMGTRAIALFSALGIKAATGADGTVHQALERFFEGSLTEALPCEESVEHGAH